MNIDTLHSISPQKIILFGIKHSGKSSLGKMLSSSLNWQFRDLDDCIEAQTQATLGVSIRDYFRFKERKHFFSIESSCLENFINNNAAPWVLATGGGIIDNESAIQLLPKQAIKIFLNIDPLILFKRIMKHGLPPFLSPDDPYKSFFEIYTSRSLRYKNIADIIVDLNDCPKEQSINSLIISLKEYLDVR